MSDSAVALQTCIRVVENHGATVDKNAGVVSFRRANEVAVRLPDDEMYTKSIVRKLQRSFNIPIHHFYNPDNCRPNCPVKNKKEEPPPC